MILAAGEVAWLVQQYWPLGSVMKAGPVTIEIDIEDQAALIATAYEESGFNTLAIGTNKGAGAAQGSQDLGLWQLNTWYHPEKLAKMLDWRNPFENTAAAVKIFKAQGLVAWHAADQLAPISLQIARSAQATPIGLAPRNLWTS